MAGKQNDPLESNPPARPGDPIDLGSSVAGEEDPGASIDFTNARDNQVGGGQPASQRTAPPAGAQPPMAPGDQAPPGTPGTGENVCPQCGGTGRLGASACPTCQGTGKVIAGIGGA
jgi:DnaJ-class molecular chaperone